MSSFVLRRSALGAAAPAARRAFTTTAPRGLARIQIIGNLAAEPELHSTSTGRECVRYAVGSNSGRGENRKTSWFRVTSFTEGRGRDYLLSVPKGSTVFVEGDITNTSFTDGNGQTRTSVSVLQRNIEVLKRPQNPEQGE